MLEVVCIEFGCVCAVALQVSVFVGFVECFCTSGMCGVGCSVCVCMCCVGGCLCE